METSTQWTPEDIRENAKNWNLEGDSQLLGLMKNISENLLQKANNTVNNVNKMAITLEKSYINFENASNKLSALSKRQFVENRVLDDDNEIKPEKNFITHEQIKAYNPNETIKVILKNNIKMLENCYDKVSVNLDDSDEEDEYVKSTVIYRPKNLYGKHLPMLIGSKEWNEKWHIGLYDSDDDSISEKGSPIEEFSDDSSENISLPSIGPTISESGSSIWSINRNPMIIKSKIPVNFVQSSDEEAISSNTFASKTSSDEISRNKNISEQTANSDFHNYYIHKPREKKQRIESSDSEEDIISDKVRNQPIPKQRISVVSQKKNREKNDIKVSNIFSDEPPDFDFEEDNKKLDKNLTNEFFDSNVVEIVPTPKKSISHNVENKTLKKNVGLFDDNDFDYFIKELNTKTSKINHKNSIKKVNLFKSDSESELDKESKTSERNVNSSINNLISSERKEVVSNERDIKNYKANDLISSIKNPTNLFDDDHEEDDLFSPIKSDNKKLSGISNSSVLLKTKITNLFDDEPPEDEFDYLFQTSKSKNNITNDVIHGIDIIPNESENKTDFQTDMKISNENVSKSESVSKSDPNLDDKIMTGISTQEDVSPNPQTLGGKRKNLLSNLFSHDWTDDEEDLFGTKEAQTTKHTLEKKSPNCEKNDGTETKNVNLEISIAPPKVPSIDFDISSKGTLKTNLLEEESIKPNLNLNENIEEIIEVNSEPNHKNSDKNKLDVGVLEKGSLFSKEIFEDKIGEASDENFASPGEVISDKNEKEQIEKKNREVNENEVYNEEDHKEIVFEEKLKEKEPLDVKSKTDFVEETNELQKESDIKTDAIYNKKDLYSLLFSDTPPEDEDIFAKSNSNATITESFPNTFKKALEQNNLLLYSNNNIGLFDDVPPDDLLEDTKKLSDIFNDEFESTPESLFETEIQPNYIINDEPPPDDYFNNNLFDESFTEQNKDFHLLHENPISDTLSKDNQDFMFKNEINQIEVSKSFNKIGDKNDEDRKISNNSGSDKLTTNDLTQKQAKYNLGLKDTTDSPLEVKEKTIPNAMIPHDTEVTATKIDETDSVLGKANLLNINVAALLPGAKRPSKGKENRTNKEIKRNNDLPSSVINNLVYSENSNNITEDGKLVGLNKSRAKILVKRKPSTRQARQESYRKSLVEDTNVLETENESLPNMLKQNDNQNKKANNTLHDISTSVKSNEENKSSDIFSENEIYQISLSKEVQSKDLRNNENWRNRSLFGESEDSDNSDLFSQLSSTKKVSSSQKDFSNNNSDNIFGDSETFNSKTSIKKLNVESEQISAYNDIFKTDFDSHGNKAKFMNTNFKQVPELDFARNENFEKNSQSISNSLHKSDNLKINFIENNYNDDDDLFSSSFVKVIPAQIPNNLIKKKTHIQQKENNFNDQAGNEIFKKVKIKKPFSEKSNSPQQKNISDVEIVSAKTHQDKSKNLFSSDDDDSLFGGSTTGNRSKKSIQNKKTENKVEVSDNQQERVRENLFDDVGNDDSDDDLFGLNKTTKAAVTSKVNKNQSNRGAIPKRPLEKKVIKTEDNYNPLADLLNQ